jgi:hypothetical protein
MRSLSITALMILAAFALGLTLGGQMPREAAALEESNGVAWENDGVSLALYNQTEEEAFLVTGAYKPGAIVQSPPWYSTGAIKLSASNLDKVVVYKLQPELACSPIECRRCDEGALCPTPDWPPLQGAKEVRSLIDYR